jgi:hypothetical protein
MIGTSCQIAREGDLYSGGMVENETMIPEWVLQEAPTRQIPGSGNTQPHGSLVRIKTPHLSQQALFESCGHQRIDSLHGLG